MVHSSMDSIRSQIPNCELIIVNDGSLQNFTASEVQNFLPQVTIINYPTNRGKGFALREGVKVARSDYILYTDVDFPYTNNSFMGIYNALAEGNDLAIGIRDETYYLHLPKSRFYLSKFLRSLIRLFLRIPTDDTQCGLKGFNRKGKEVFLQTTIHRYLFDLEFVFLSARKKLKIKTVEVQLRPEVVLSTMNWKILLQEFGNFLKIFAQSLF